MTLKKHFSAILSITLLGWIAYHSVYGGEFVFDDMAYIVNNTRIRDLSDLQAIWRAAPTPARFVAYLSFAVNYHFHGLDVFGYHFVNVAIHVCNGLWVYALGTLLFQLPYLKQKQDAHHLRQIAWLAAALFVVHPLQTEAVSYIVQRFTSLAVFFYLAALCCYLRFRLNQKYRWMVMSVLLTVSAMLTKQISFTLPIMMLLIDVFFIQRKKGGLSWRGLFPFLLLLGLIPAVLNFNWEGIFGRTYPSRSHTGDMITMGSYALTQLRVIWRYIFLFFFPIGQTLDYDFPLSYSFLETRVWLSAGALSGLAGWMVWKLQTQRFLVFCLVWFFFTISITTSLIPIPQVIFEHRCYLPSVGIFLGIAYVLRRSFCSERKYSTAIVLILGVCLFLTIQRNQVWQSTTTLWEDIIVKAPEKTRGYNNLGIGYFQEGRFRESAAMFTEVIRRNPYAARAWSNRGLAYQAMGEDERAMQDFTQAIDVLAQAQDPLTGKTSNRHIWADMFTNRGQAYAQQGQWDAAAQDFREAARRNPRSERAFYQWGLLLEQQGEFESALRTFHQAADLDPLFHDAHISVGLMHHALGQYQQAIAVFSKVITLQPHNAYVYYYRMLSHYQEGNLESAKKDLKFSREYGYQPANPSLKAVIEEIDAF